MPKNLKAIEIPESIKLLKKDKELIKKLDGVISYGYNVKVYAEQPHKLVEVNNRLAGYYSYLIPFAVEYEVAKGIFWQEYWGKGEKKMSDKKLQMLWRTTSSGLTQYYLKHTLRALEKSMKAVSNTTFVLNQEAKNNY